METRIEGRELTPSDLQGICDKARELLGLIESHNRWCQVRGDSLDLSGYRIVLKVFDLADILIPTLGVATHCSAQDRALPGHDENHFVYHYSVPLQDHLSRLNQAIEHLVSEVTGTGTIEAAGGKLVRPKESTFHNGTIAAEMLRVAVDQLTEGLTARALQAQQTKPQWDPATGELFFNGKVVKRIKNLGPAKNVVKVLNTFEQENWPHRIDDPLPHPSSAERVNKTVESLNSNLAGITFSADGTGKGFRWEISPS